MKSIYFSCFAAVLAVLLITPSAQGYWEWMNPLPQGNSLNEVWTSSDGEIFGVGDHGTIVHWTGSEWQLTHSSLNYRMGGVWGFSSDNVYAVGNGTSSGEGIILHYDGTNWLSLGPDTEWPLRGIWGPAPDNIIAVGSGGRAMHYNGSTWSSRYTGTYQTLSAVHGTGPNDIYAVGQFSTLLHYNGSSWSQVSHGFTEDFTNVWCVGPDDVYVTGGGEFDDARIIHWDGSIWSEVYYQPAGWGIWDIWAEQPMMCMQWVRIPA